MPDHRRTSRRFPAFALLGAALLAVSGVACGKDTESARAAGRAKAQESRPVRVVAAAVGPLPRTVTVTGTLAADEEVVAGFKVAGRVNEIAVDLGSPVRKGQVLARLDPTDFRLRVEQAEAALRQVRAGLGLPGDGSGESVDPGKTALVREAGAVLEEARLNRDRMARLWEKNYIARSEVDASQSRLLVATIGGAPVRVRDIGRAEDGTREQRSTARLNGVPTVVLEVRRQSGANTVAVIEDAKRSLAAAGELPAGVGGCGWCSRLPGEGLSAG